MKLTPHRYLTLRDLRIKTWMKLRRFATEAGSKTLPINIGILMLTQLVFPGNLGRKPKEFAFLDEFVLLGRLFITHGYGDCPMP